MKAMDSHGRGVDHGRPEDGPLRDGDQPGRLRRLRSQRFPKDRFDGLFPEASPSSSQSKHNVDIGNLQLVAQESEMVDALLACLYRPTKSREAALAEPVKGSQVGRLAMMLADWSGGLSG